MDPTPGGTGARIRRRHVLYVPGYDPRSPRIYFLLFSRELRKFAALNRVAASLKRDVEPAPPDRPGTRWRLAARWPDGPVETTVEVMDWHDLCARDFAAPKWRQLLTSLRVLLYAVTSGTLPAMLRLNWKFGLFSIYPWAMMVSYLVIAIGLIAAILALASALGLPWWAGIPPAAAALYGGLRITERLDARLYVWYLVNDWIFTWRHRTRRDPVIAERFELFARHLARTARASDADELLVIGHSSGSFVATGIVARALELDPAVGREGPALRLLTLGANTPIAAAGRDAPPARAAIAALVPEDRVTWIEYFAPQDVLCFPWLDPVAAFGIAAAPRRNPHVRSARLKEIMTPERYAAMAWRFYRTHFAFLDANDLPGEYDFYRFLAGPEPLEAVLSR